MLVLEVLKVLKVQVLKVLVLKVPVLEVLGPCQLRLTKQAIS